MRSAINAYRESAESRAASRGWTAEMTVAIERGECFITADGWCATHSTVVGPIYCEHTPAAVTSAATGLADVSEGSWGVTARDAGLALPALRPPRR